MVENGVDVYERALPQDDELYKRNLLNNGYKKSCTIGNFSHSIFRPIAGKDTLSERRKGHNHAREVMQLWRRAGPTFLVKQQPCKVRGATMQWRRCNHGGELEQSCMSCWGGDPSMQGI
jgi:hypothetical protein